jgi:phosphoribosyl-AMP cyclohydrolase
VGGAACHNGYKSCFYRKLAAGADADAPDSLKLELIGRPVFDPATVYKKK